MQEFPKWKQVSEKSTSIIQPFITCYLSPELGYNEPALAFFMTLLIILIIAGIVVVIVFFLYKYR